MPSSHLSGFYRGGLGLLTDLYQLTMAYSYWKKCLHERKSVFHLTYRTPPFSGNYIISCGLELVVDFLEHLHFSWEDLRYLAGLKGADGRALFDRAFLVYLQKLEFNCCIDAIPEGLIILPHEPLVRVQGPLLQAQIIETALLNLINFSSLIATKASRIVQAAGGDSVLEFGLRRAQGIDGAITASRATYIGGCAATSNVMAGKLYDIPVVGTHAHSWVMCFDDELEAFRQYADAMPNNCVFLVDTYHSLKGIENAITAAKELRQKGYEMLGIRLDSGDLAELSIVARKMLDKAGFPKAAIIASNDLDEYRIKTLKDKGCKIAIWGVGTRLSTAYGQPALGGVYKLSAIQDEKGEWEYKVKLSEQQQKGSNPGILQVRRFFEKSGQAAGDQIYDIHHNSDSFQLVDFNTNKVVKFKSQKPENLLCPILRQGALVYKFPSIHEIREKALKQQELFRQTDWENYPSGLEVKLNEIKQSLINMQRGF